MAYPNTSVLNIIIPQTSASIQDGQAPFVERIISGSRLILQTTIDGTLTGSSDLNVNSITASNISASGYISASNLWVNTNITDAGTLTVVGNSILSTVFATNVTASNISASGFVSASAIFDTGTLTVLGNSILSNVTASNISASGNISASNEYIEGTLTVIGNSTLSTVFATNITASNISASGNISASTLRVETSIVDGGSLTVLGNTVLGDAITDTTRITGSASISGSLSVVGTTTLQSTFATNITASNISASGTIIATDITASNEVLIGSGPIYRTWSEQITPEDRTKLYVSGSATIFGNYATLTLATSASDAGAQSNIIFSRLGPLHAAPGDTTPVLVGRMALGIDSGSNDLRVFGYYASTDPENNAFSNINMGTRAIFKQNGYFGIGSFISYGQYGGSVIDYKSSLPGFAGQNYVGPDALLTLLPADSGSVGTAGSKQYNRNILNIMSYDTSSIMFISGSDGYVLLGKNTTDGINRLQVAGNVSASAYTGSSAIITNLIATNITSSNISASGNISSSTLTVVGNSTLSNVFATNITASNISASGNISSSTLYVVGNGTINGGLQVNGNSILGNDLTDVNTSSGSLRVLNAADNDQLTYTNGALIVDGGVGIGKNLFVSGSMLVGGDFTVFGSSSVVYISSSTVIINDNIIQLNAFFPFERYAGIEVFDSGSNQRSASLLWDGHNDNWITVDQNNSSSNVIVGPTASFGTNPGSLTANNIPKAYDATGIADSLISDDGTTLLYTGTRISASSITASNGALTNISGALITYVTGSFTALTVVTGSSPGVGSQVPTSPTDVGMPGQIEVDNNFIYVYTNNIWKRVPLSTWSI